MSQCRQQEGETLYFDTGEWTTYVGQVYKIPVRVNYAGNMIKHWTMISLASRL
ncbi:MAG: hypothetical protein PHS44_01075 [Candidatus Dojkabacteria bacterium]|nr:hypothetical protein [Candidatus Dojkabacteria bacterium]